MTYRIPNQKPFLYTHTNGQEFEVWEDTEDAAKQYLSQLGLTGGAIKPIAGGETVPPIE
jgi:hypothetical protein